MRRLSEDEVLNFRVRTQSWRIHIETLECDTSHNFVELSRS